MMVPGFHQFALNVQMRLFETGKAQIYSPSPRLNPVVGFLEAGRKD